MKDRTIFDFWPEYRQYKEEERSFNLIDFDEPYPVSVIKKDEAIPDESYIKRKHNETGNETLARISKEEIKAQEGKVTRKVLEYENWLGRIVDLEPTIVSAHITNTLNHHSKRFVRIEKSFFVSKGVTEELTFGDEFELSYQTFRVGKGPVRHDEFVRMIHHIKSTKAEIDAYVDEQMRALDFLFE